MNAVDALAEYFAASPRHSPGLSGRSGVQGQVDDILNELQLPAELDKDGDWKVQSDVGPFLLIVDKESSDLLLVQTIQSMQKKVKNSADEMHVLLALNFEAHGVARFGAIKDSGQDLLVLTARLAPATISRDSVEGMLGDSMRLSRRVDELLGNAPTQGTEQPPAPAGGWQAADAELAQAEQAPPAGDGAPPPAAASSPPPQAAPVAQQQQRTEPPASPPPSAQPSPPPQQPAQPAAASPPPQAAPSSPPTSAQPSPPPSAQPSPAPQQPAAASPLPQPQQPAQDLPAANWYADPYGQARLRYWDGRQWTQHTAQ